MEKLKSDERIKSIGITALGDIDAINEVVLSDCFDVAQIYYNLLIQVLHMIQVGIGMIMIFQI